MFSIGHIWSRRPPRERVDWTLHTCSAPRPIPFPAPRRPVRQASASPHIYIYLRSFAADGRGHVLQYSFVDDRGNVVMSAFASSPSPVGLACGEPPEDLPVEPLDSDELEYLISRVCAGACLVGYGRVLQGGLLPAAALQAAAGVECAWRRFHRVAKGAGLRLDRSEGLCLEDALARIGLPAPESCDAVMRALAIRDLWAWMDRVE
jgi:hypothetical protein